MTALHFYPSHSFQLHGTFLSEDRRIIVKVGHELYAMTVYALHSVKPSTQKEISTL